MSDFGPQFKTSVTGMVGNSWPNNSVHETPPREVVRCRKCGWKTSYQIAGVGKIGFLEKAKAKAMEEALNHRCTSR